MANKENRRLQELDGSKYEIADGQPDIRGWDVLDGNGWRIGEVDDLIFDPEARKVRYIKVDLEGNVFDLEDRDVLVPIGLAELRENGDDVILNNVTAEQLRALPEYDDDDDLSPEYESRIRSVFAGLGGAAFGAGAASGTGNVQDVESDFYGHEHFDDERLYRNRKPALKQDETEQTIPIVREDLEVGKREVEQGGIRLRSRIVETPVEETVRLREEHATVERIPVDRPAAEDSLREEQVEVREQAEVPVVNKEARVVEEVRLGKEVTERDETIRDTVRNTEIDIDDTTGRTDNRDEGTNRTAYPD